MSLQRTGAGAWGGPYDIVLFGATGFVGALTAEYLAAHAPDGLRWALAGRRPDEAGAAARAAAGGAARRCCGRT